MYGTVTLLDAPGRTIIIKKRVRAKNRVGFGVVGSPPGLIKKVGMVEWMTKAERALIFSRWFIH
jgi:hypothetical protein